MYMLTTQELSTISAFGMFELWFIATIEQPVFQRGLDGERSSLLKLKGVGGEYYGATSVIFDLLLSTICNPLNTNELSPHHLLGDLINNSTSPCQSI